MGKRGRGAGLTEEERFWKNVDKPSGDDGCWPWRGGRFNHGYGMFYRQNFDYENRKYSFPVPAHRFAYGLVHGMPPSGIWILHTCDNPLCVNPRHLRPGDHQENMADMIRKGRDSRTHQKNRCVPFSRMTFERVRQLRALHADGESTYALAASFGISRTHVSDIVHRRRWAQVP